MKAKIIVSFIMLMLVLGGFLPLKTTSAQGLSVGLQVFYDELSPYGTWVETPQYGYAWIPDVDPGFAPYSTNGYWVFTDQGWTWVSNYSWGWAPFHYGRWYNDEMYGPMWVPGNEWGPGWVTWRRSDGFYGWAPIGPGVSISFAYSNNYYVPNNQWTFVRNRDFGRTNINKYYINTTYNVTIINNSKVIHNNRFDRVRHVTYNSGPDRGEVERHAGKRFNPVAIKEINKPGHRLDDNQLQLYRPHVNKNISGKPKLNQQLKHQPVREQSQPKRQVQPVREQSQPKHQVQPVREQSQPKRQVQPVREQSQPKHQVQPVREQSQPKHQVQPVKQQTAQPKLNKPSKKSDEKNPRK